LVAAHLKLYSQAQSVQAWSPPAALFI